MAAYSLHRIIAIALILAITIPSSLGHKHHHHGRHHHHKGENGREEPDMEQDLRDLCSDTPDSNRCWNIIKSELDRFHDNDWRSVAGVVIDLARAKAEEIHDTLNGWYRDSNDDKLKEKYHSCSENYNDAARNMDSAKSKLDSDDYQNILEQVDDAVRELESCRREFDEGSFDPGHVGDRNNEFGNYVDIVKVAADRLRRENESN